MRIAVVTTSYPAFPGDPAGHFVETEARALAATGSEVVVLAPAPALASATPSLRVVPIDGGTAFGAPGALARIREAPLRALGALGFVRNARKALRRLGPFDQVVAHWLVPSGWPIATAISASDFEVVVHGSDVEVLMRLPAPARHAIIRRLTKKNARFRFVSKSARDRLTRDGFPKLRDATVAPSPIDVPKIERGEARAALGVTGDARLLVVVARLVAEKRVDVAVRAASLVPNARIVVVGDGPERAALERGFPEASFVGALPRGEALRWMAAADVVVSASRHEGAPTVVREARALGVPVVTAEAGDVAEWAETDGGIVVVR